VVTLVATFIVAMVIAQQGQQLLGLTATHDPAPWIILAAGVSASLMFAGLGYSLAVLCAIYDRQGTLDPARGGTSSSALKPQSTDWRAARSLDVVSRAAPAPTAIATTPGENVSATSVNAPVVPQGALWGALTKERHLRKSRG
jgi:hypothetical protein